MDISKIRKALKNGKIKYTDEGNRYSVLVPLIEIDNELHLIYEVRSMSIKRQPGEISFPGGKIEEDESPLDAAVRETKEETGIGEKNIEIITELDYVTNKSGFFVFAFLGYISNVDYSEIKFSEDEVAELFYVPLSFFMENEPEKYYINYYPSTDENFPKHLINGGEDYDWEKIRNPVYFYRYKDYVIWGLTAKITYNLVKMLNSYQEQYSDVD